MEKYKVTFLTQQGIKSITVSKDADLDKLSEEIKSKYGTFVTISSELIS